VVAYLMTHYPKHSQTFLLDEILGVQGDEVRILPMALNAPESGDVASDLERAEQSRTFYVKSTPKAEILRTLASLARQDPIGLSAVALGALRTAGFDLGAALRSLFYLVEAALVWSRCEREDCRHIHAQFGTAPATVARLAARLGNRLRPERPVTWSFTVHGYHEFTAEAAHDIAGKVRDAAFVVAVSDFTRSQLMRLSPPEAWAKVHRVHCGIALDRFSFEPRAEIANPAVVLAVGRLSPEKGQLLLVEAAGLLKERNVNVRICIVGDGPSRDVLRDRVRLMGVDEIVEFKGPVPAEQVAAMLREADVFVLPSFAEGIPVSIMEALACGVPVVSTRVGGVAELVEDGVTGRTVSAGRADLVAEAIESLILDADLRDRVRRAGRDRVAREHDGRRTALELRHLLATYLTPDHGQIGPYATGVVEGSDSCGAGSTSLDAAAE
jgi:glycosyltransferase involved in cell wall biosynthesis